ncbi:MAG: hypothetical protein H7144_14375 [Burkholderiales bacterium]|nr:hypothetical protein [Phycisphaerae bacterium]
MSMDVTGQVSADQQRGKLYFLHALGRAALPEMVAIDGRVFRVTTFIKHDFFAATGFYRCEQTGQKGVLKMARTEPFLGLPTKWLGRLINERELRFYRRLSDLPNVPAVIGRVGETGFMHAYVEGRPVEKGMAVPDGFFAELLGLIDTFYLRGIALVDTNKPENILLGDDGRPHLIDFQISFDVHNLGGIWPATALLRAFRRTDVYHILKHKNRLRPDQMTDAERRIVERRSLAVRLHRTLTKPYFIVRRRLFAYLRDRGRLMPEGSK